MSSDEKNVRHRFTVPLADTKVNEWIENQSNLGFSLRVLIKAFVREYGYQDATCLEFGTEVKKRGRPPKSLKDQVDTAYDYDDEEPDQTEPVVVTRPTAKPDIKQEIKTEAVPKQTQKAEVKPPVQSNVDIESMLSGSSASSTNSVTNTNIDTDDDGFVDPESLF